MSPPAVPLGRLALACLAPLGLFLAFALHGIGGGTFPPGLNHDAAWHGRYALRLLQGTEAFSVFTPECWGQENLFSYTLAGFFKWFGIGQTQIELHATLYGALGVVAFFALVFSVERSVRRSVFCALLFAAGGALTLYSRVGWRLISLVPVVCLVILFALRCGGGQRPARRGDAAWLGVWVGVSFYTYLQARVLVAYLLAFWLVRLLARRPGGERAAEGRRAAVSLAAYGLVSLPMWIYAARHFTAWNARAAHFLSETGPAEILPRVGQTLGLFNWSGQADDFYTAAPALEGLCHGLWVLGLGLAVARWRRQWPVLLLFGCLLLPCLVARPNLQRAFGVMPVVYLFIAQAALWLGERLWTWQLPRLGAPRTARLVAAAAVALVGAQALATWHKLYVRAEPFAWGFYADASAVGRYLGAHRADGGPGFAVCARNLPEDTLRFLANPTLAEDPAPFRNYQNYTGPAQDGVGDLLADLTAGGLGFDRRIIVGASVEEAFITRVTAAGHRLTAQDLIRESEGGAVVARVFGLRPAATDQAEVAAAAGADEDDAAETVAPRIDGEP